MNVSIHRPKGSADTSDRKLRVLFGGKHKKGTRFLACSLELLSVSPHLRTTHL